MKAKETRYWRSTGGYWGVTNASETLSKAVRDIMSRAYRCSKCRRPRNVADAPSCLGCARDEAEKAQTV